MSYVPPKKNAAYITYVGLYSQANPSIFQANPTLAAGDVKVAIDDGDPANLATLPEVDANFTKRVKVSLSAAEMNGDNITIIFSDAAGDEWCDLVVNIQTSTNQIDDLATSLAAIDVGGSVIEGTLTLQQTLRIILAYIAGNVTGGGTTAIKFYSQDDGTIRIQMTVDELGNRSLVDVDGT